MAMIVLGTAASFVGRNVARSLTAVLLGFLLAAPVQAAENQDQQIKQAIIADSIASYSGSCPCPYNVARNGSRCGGRSAYNRAGGYSPICFEQDVTPAMIQSYKVRNAIQ